MQGLGLTITQHVIFDVLARTVDVYGDFNFAREAFLNGHYRIGCLMIFPVLLNIFFSLYKWYSTDFDTTKEKRFTWLLVLICMWHQYQVIKLLLSIFRGHSKSIWKPLQDKIKKELSFIEPFVEAIPQLIASMGVCGLILGKRYQKVCPELLVSECVIAHNHTSPIDTLFSVEGRINFSQDDTAITEVFGTTTLGIPNNIMFPLNVIISFVTAVKCIMDYFHDGPLKMTSDTKSGRAVISSAMLVYVSLSFYGKMVGAMGYAFMGSDGVASSNQRCME